MKESLKPSSHMREDKNTIFLMRRCARDLNNPSVFCVLSTINKAKC